MTRGKTVQAYGVVQDITESKQAEEALKESEERFRVLSDGSPLGVSLINQDGSYGYINPSFVNMFGYTLQDIKTVKGWFNLAYPDEEYRNMVENILEEDSTNYPRGNLPARIFDVICKDGGIKTIMFWPVITASNVRFVLYEDITDQKKAEDALRESEERFRDLAELLPETIFEMDLLGNLLFVNQNAFEQFQFSQSDFDNGLNVFDMITPRDCARAKIFFQKALDGEDLGLNEYTLLKKDGRFFSSYYYCQPNCQERNNTWPKGDDNRYYRTQEGGRRAQ